MDNILIQQSPANKGRKKLPDIANRKREKARIRRYSATSLPLYPQCKHDGKNGPYQCINKSIISLAAIRDFHRQFYLVKNKIEQDKFLVKYCTTIAPKRKKKHNITIKAKDMTVKHYIRLENGDEVQICRKSFLNILGIGKDRVLNVLRRHRSTGALPKENRGGDRVRGKNDLQRLKVMEFIESLTCTESHYSRSKNSLRKYLPCDLNISKLWRVFNGMQDNIKVKLCFFRKIFTRNYNIGFGSRQSDVCSTCTQFTDRMKTVKSPESKAELMAHQRVHKLRAQCFYDLLKQKQDDVEMFSFDCEKNLPLPKLPDQAYYFSMQVNLYNFCIVTGPSSTRLNSRTVSSFIWSEVDRPKSSNEIASAVFYKLTYFIFKKTTTTVRLIADGCAGQNKNSSMVGMCMFWLDCFAPKHITEVQLIFPVVGHSFIPPDWVFGNIERVIKKTPTIVSPEEYINIIKEHSTVFQMGKNYQVVDFKKQVALVLKPTTAWHFKISKVKRIIVTRSTDNSITVRGELHYRNDLETPKSLLKRGKEISQLKPRELPLDGIVKPEKTKSISDLLKKHYGDGWKNEHTLSYFKTSFMKKNQREANPPPQSDLVLDTNEEGLSFRV